MIAASLQSTQTRLAHHYLNKLRAADGAVRRGQANAAYGFALFDQEWEQIKFWHNWVAEQRANDEGSARLRKEFPLAGLEILPHRINAADHTTWLIEALEAARQLQDGEAERTLCYELRMIYYRLGVPEKVEYYASQLLKLGEAANDVLAIERAYQGLGASAEERGDFAAAEMYYQRALQLSTELHNDVEIGQALNSLGMVADSLGDYQKAYHYFLRYLELMEANGRKRWICHALLMMGHILIGLKDYRSAEDYLQRAARIGKALDLRRLYGVSLMHLGWLMRRQNQLEAAYHYLEEGIQAVRSIGIVRQITSGLSEQGFVLLRMGNPLAALARLQEGLQLARESGHPLFITTLQGYLCVTHLALNDVDAARSALCEMIALVRNLDSRPQKVEAISIVVAYYQSIGLNHQAAVWLGTIIGDPNLDEAFDTPIHAKLETTLGVSAYQRALEKGRTRSVDDVVVEIADVLA